jgi:hypothetical protein
VERDRRPAGGWGGVRRGSGGEGEGRGGGRKRGRGRRIELWVPVNMTAWQLTVHKVRKDTLIFRQLFSNVGLVCGLLSA